MLNSYIHFPVDVDFDKLVDYLCFSMLVWNECEDKTFHEACIHEVITNGHDGSRLKASAWKTIHEKNDKQTW